MYLNYYENEVNDEGDNKPIGIMLCTDKDAPTAEYALGGLSNNIFASKYTYYIPDKEQLTHDCFILHCRTKSGGGFLEGSRMVREIIVKLEGEYRL